MHLAWQKAKHKCGIYKAGNVWERGSRLRDRLRGTIAMATSTSGNADYDISDGVRSFAR
jgi:hypothetical protein